MGQQSHGIVEPGHWAYFALTLEHADAVWQGGLAVAFLTVNGGHPVVLQKYGAIPTLDNCDSVLRCDICHCCCACDVRGLVMAFKLHRTAYCNCKLLTAYCNCILLYVV